jgi:hypothetical protein
MYYKIARGGNFSSLSIAYAIMISITFVPSILPRPNYFAVIVLSLVLISYVARGYKIRVNFSKMPVFYILSVLFLYLHFFQEIISSIIYGYGSFSVFGPLIFLTVFWFILNYYASEYGVEKLIKIYIYVCLYISITGVLSWLIISFGFVDPTRWELNLTQLTEGRFVRDLDGNLFTFPYYLGVIIQGGGKYSLFGFEFMRACGLSTEPQYATFLVAPSLFMINIVYKKSRLFKKAAYVLVILFLLIASSMTTYLILYVLIFLLLLKKRSLLGCVSLLLLIVLLYYYYNQFAIHEYKSLLVEKFVYFREPFKKDVNTIFLLGLELDGNLFSYGMTNTLGKTPGLFNLLPYLGVVGFSILSSVQFFFSRSPYSLFGLSHLYVFLHLQKLNGPGIVGWPFMLYIVITLGYLIALEKKNVEYCGRVVAKKAA